MREGGLVGRARTLISDLSTIAFARGEKSDLKAAWSAWEDGEVERASAIAGEALDTTTAPDEAHHLLFLTAFVTGKYRDALDHYRSIGGEYRRLAELATPVIDVYVHLDLVADAAAFARGRAGVPAVTVARLEQHARRPLQVELSGVAVVPVANHPLTEYFPAFSAEVNGHALTAHIDTGGSFLLMGPPRAAALGIRTVKAGADRAHLNLMRVEMSYGIAERFAIGGAVLHDVPVDVLSTLTGEGDWVIFGTNILERFLSTMDYPNRRLILSKRGDVETAGAHRAMLPPEGVSVPFHLWGDHLMFARGRDLNLFVDSGLVSLHPDGKGGTRQASFTSSKRRCQQWGMPAADIGRGFFEWPGRLSLGSLDEDRPMVVVGAAGDQNFGGVRIDGLISHAFLKRYAWTIDFDTHQYRFAGRAAR